MIVVTKQDEGYEKTLLEKYEHITRLSTVIHQAETEASILVKGIEVSEQALNYTNTCISNGKPYIINQVTDTMETVATLTGMDYSQYFNPNTNITAGTESIMDSISNFIQAIFDAIASIISKIVDLLTKLIEGIVDFFTSFFKEKKEDEKNNKTKSLKDKYTEVKEQIIVDRTNANKMGTNFKANIKNDLEVNLKETKKFLANIPALFIVNDGITNGELNYSDIIKFLTDFNNNIDRIFSFDQSFEAFKILDSTETIITKDIESGKDFLSLYGKFLTILDKATKNDITSKEARITTLYEMGITENGGILDVIRHIITVFSNSEADKYYNETRDEFDLYEHDFIKVLSKVSSLEDLDYTIVGHSTDEIFVTTLPKAKERFKEYGKLVNELEHIIEDAAPVSSGERTEEEINQLYEKFGTNIERISTESKIPLSVNKTDAPIHQVLYIISILIKEVFKNFNIRTTKFNIVSVYGDEIQEIARETDINPIMRLSEVEVKLELNKVEGCIDDIYNSIEKKVKVFKEDSKKRVERLEASKKIIDKFKLTLDVIIERTSKDNKTKDGKYVKNRKELTEFANSLSNYINNLTANNKNVISFFVANNTIIIKDDLKRLLDKMINVSALSETGIAE